MKSFRLSFLILALSMMTGFAETNLAVPDEKQNGWKFLSDINVSVFPAFFSSFMEKPGPLATEKIQIWGDFGTIYAEGSCNIEPIPFLPWITIHPEVRGGWIMPNKMYLGYTSKYVTIGGFILGFNADLGIRPINDKNYFLELRAGFVLNGGMKLFFDYAQNNTVVHPGASGYYNFIMFGPEFTLEGRWTFIPSIGLGIQAAAFWSPSYENHSTVLNAEVLKDDFAPGYRSGGKALLAWNNSDFLVSLGWQYELIYFTWAYSTHDLNIVYMGPVVQMTFLF